MLFEIRPAGRGAPRIDPKPILDGWKLLESTAIYRAAGKNPFFGPDAKTPSIGQILLMSKEALVQRVLANPRIEIYECGRHDIRTGQVDRRVLATLEFLAASGLRPTVTSLKCGHGFLTASGNVSQHSSGNAVDIATINGIPILGNQGKGSITELAVRRLLTLQGTMKPDQIITLMTFEGADNTLAMGDHADHIHVGWRAALRHQLQGRQAGQRGAQARPVDQADRPARKRSTTRPCASSPRSTRSRSPSAPPRRTAASKRGAAASRRFAFVQWEFAGRSGRRPAATCVRRYAGDDARHVIVIGDLEAPRRRRLARRRPRSAAPGSRARRRRGHARDGDHHRPARRRRRAGVARRRRARPRRRRSARRSLLLNRAIHGHRLAASDPYVSEVRAGQALATRIGYGSGEQVAEGDWEDARELPPPKPAALDAPARRRSASPRCSPAATSRWPARSSRCAPGSTSTRAASARRRCSSRLALDAALAELEGWRGTRRSPRRLDELHGHREPVDAAAHAALQGGLQAEHIRGGRGGARAAGGRAAGAHGEPVMDERWAAVDDYLSERLAPGEAALDRGAGGERGGRAARRPTCRRPRAGCSSCWRGCAAREAILEIGTLGGYSDDLAGPGAAARTGGIVTLEADPHHAQVARSNLARAGLAEVGRDRGGPGPRDAAGRGGPVRPRSSSTPTRSAAPTTSALALEHSRPGTLIVADNVVRGGAVVDAEIDDPRVVGVRRLVEAVAAEPRLVGHGAADGRRRRGGTGWCWRWWCERPRHCRRTSTAAG